MSRVKNPYTRVSIPKAIDAAIANCDFMIHQSKAVIKVERDMPEIVCDRIKITAIFFNLISNAIKFAKPNETPVIRISCHETRELYEFCVEDNGIGIDPLYHQEIFDIFKRLHPPDQYAGSGVGLAIVKAALEDQGGQVRVESNLNQGAKFIFTIPKNLPEYKPLY